MKGYTVSKNGKIVIGILLFIIVICAVGTSFIAINRNKIVSNISIEGIDVSGLSQDAAMEKVRSKSQSMIDASHIVLKYDKNSWTVSYNDLAYVYNYQEAVDKAYHIGHKDDLFTNLFNMINAQYNKVNIPLSYAYDKKVLEKLMGDISKSINQEPVDATISMQEKGFVITDEREGRLFNDKKALELLLAELKTVKNYELILPVETTTPTIKKADLESIQDKLGEYATKFNVADADRTYNIKLAAKSAINVLLQPGEVFSLNKTVGPRLAKYGYKMANVIVNSELVPGIGGGVCQVSSTLYNAVLLSNLKIIERRNHALISAYVPLGRDATISGDYIDFKFENSTSSPIFVYGEVKGSWLRFYIYGKNEHPGRTVSIKTEVVKKIEPEIKIIEDPTLTEGTVVVDKKAFPGYVVKTTRIVMENGKQISAEPLFTDKYKVSNGIKRIGTKKVESQTSDMDITEPYQN